MGFGFDGKEWGLIWEMEVEGTFDLNGVARVCLVSWNLRGRLFNFEFEAHLISCRRKNIEPTGQFPRFW